MTHILTDQDRDFLTALRIDPGYPVITTELDEEERCDCEKHQELREGRKYVDEFDDIWREFQRSWADERKGKNR